VLAFEYSSRSSGTAIVIISSIYDISVFFKILDLERCPVAVMTFHGHSWSLQTVQHYLIDDIPLHIGLPLYCFHNNIEGTQMIYEMGGGPNQV